MNVGRYTVVRELGRGAMGVVYRAHDPHLDRDVALKVLREDRSVDAAFMKRFLAEARALGRLDHPGIVRVFNVDEADGTVHIAMEFVEGESLDAIMRARRLPPEEIARIGAEIASALDYAHARGIVHRDIKPSNVLVRPDGSVKITDFGIARIEDPSSQSMTQAGEVLGTPAYMSPEQVLGRPVDGRSDIFSLGIVLHEMCAGTRPFGGESLGAVFDAITRAVPDPIAAANPDIPPALCRVVAKCLEKEPGARYQTGAALAEALRTCLSQETAGGAAPSRARGKGRGAKLAVAALAIAVLGGAAAILLLRGAPPSPSRDAQPAGSAPGGTAAAPGAGVAAPPEARATLKVESDPPGAAVEVDGAGAGRTPVSLTSSPGAHAVRVHLPGYADLEARVDLRAGVETPLFARLSSLKPAQSRGEPPRPAGAGTGAPGAARQGAKSTAAGPGPEGDAAVAKDLEDAIRSYERGQLDVSITMLESVLRRDAGNRRAREYLEKARAQRQRVLDEWKKELENAPVTGGRTR